MAVRASLRAVLENVTVENVVKGELPRMWLSWWRSPTPGWGGGSPDGLLPFDVVLPRSARCGVRSPALEPLEPQVVATSLLLMFSLTTPG